MAGDGDYFEIDLREFLPRAKTLLDGAEIRRLRLTGVRCDRSDFGRLLACKHLARLEALDLSTKMGYSQLTDHGVRRLAACPSLRGLTELALSGFPEIGPSSALAIATSPHLARLVTLKLAGSRLGAEGVRALMDSPHLGHLTALDLAGQECWETYTSERSNRPNIGLEGVRLLAESPWSRRLRWLDLSYNQIGEEGVSALVTSPHLDLMETLRINEDESDYVCTRNGLDPGSRRRLAERFSERLRIPS